MVTLDEKLESVSRRELADLGMDASARNIATYSQMLLDELGKERAMDVIYKQRYDFFYAIARKSAEAQGNPKDFKTLAERSKDSFDRPFVVPSEIVELTETRYRFRSKGCLIGNAILKLNLDQDLLDVVKLWFTHDFGHFKGWNPDMKFDRLKFILDGDDCCEFVCEMEE